ncbi:MAG TPA: DUF5684 domain-containing protein [Coriobacteriia bacterium]|nr:DUF5684 domain-containing protein [Coriobacteriia bacterium]
MQLDATQYLTSTNGETSSIVSVIWAVVMIIAMWKVFEKAGRPGWAAIIPIYNIYILLKVAGWSGWWLLVLLIPLVNVLVSLFITYDLARVFGKGFGYFLGLWFFGFIFLPILGFGRAQYQGRSA